jgi:hypothetical protein
MVAAPVGVLVALNLADYRLAGNRGSRTEENAQAKSPGSPADGRPISSVSFSFRRYTGCRSGTSRSRATARYASAKALGSPSAGKPRSSMSLCPGCPEDGLPRPCVMAIRRTNYVRLICRKPNTLNVPGIAGPPGSELSQDVRLAEMIGPRTASAAMQNAPSAQVRSAAFCVADPRDMFVAQQLKGDSNDR